MNKHEFIDKIARVISEDISINNGLIFETIHGINIDGDALIDRFMKKIDAQYIDFNYNDPKFQEVWNYFFPDIGYARSPEIIRQSSQSAEKDKLSDILRQSSKSTADTQIMLKVDKLAPSDFQGLPGTPPPNTPSYNDSSISSHNDPSSYQDLDMLD